MSNTRQNHPPQPEDHGSPARPDYQGAPANALPLTASEDRQWATMAHFGGILGFVPSLIIYLVFKDRGPFTAQESKEALNFTLPPTLLALLAWLLSFIPVIGGFFAIINALLWITVAVASVIAGIECNRGRPYRYRFNLRRIR
ncbi:DUF4870 domain-containing protein [Arthrobacter gallicola]|uniref:DUF4870 domain-containing protein n=1 Tax=Arthrobacter gallicola TaxID=2762225 RepID=UPI00296AC093|nr:DUF4870 domain-containing protein [Arthrobacter gallicola]